MACFPLFIELEGKKCLVIGGGEVAFRKASVLADFGAQVLVVAPKVSSEMAMLIRRRMAAVRLLPRTACAGDAEGMDMVFCASDDSQLHREVAVYCREHRIPVNTADDKDFCTFFFPALVRREDIVIGITTGGSSPAAARYLRQQIEKQLPFFWGGLVKQLGSFRRRIKDSIADRKERETLFARLLEIGLEREGCLPETLILQQIEEVQKEEKTKKDKKRKR